MFRLLTILFLTFSALPAAADVAPNLNVEPHCRAVAKLMGTSDFAESCLRREMALRDQLAAAWEQFEPADRASCLTLSRAGAGTTYTELVSCLELKRNSRRLRERNSTTGSAGPLL